MFTIPNFEPAPEVRPLFNIGATLDIPTGTWLKGKYGENLLNGGLGTLTGVVGIPNNFKSTALHYMMLKALSRVIESKLPLTYMSTYDTETNMHKSRLTTLAQFIQDEFDKSVIDDGLWSVTDSAVYPGNEYYEIFRKFMKEKHKQKKTSMVKTPFVDKDNNFMEMILPTFGEIDSFSEFKTEDDTAVLEKGEAGSNEQNTYWMRNINTKTKMLAELPDMLSRSGHFMGLAAHLGKEGPAMQAGPPGVSIPTKKLQNLKHGDKVKGTGDKFLFATSNCWNAQNAAPYLNQRTRGAEYPLEGENEKQTQDFMKVTLVLLRSKSGQTGTHLELCVSQVFGVLPTLTEFNLIRDKGKYFGLAGGDQNFAPDLMPEVKLNRTNVRTKIDNDPLLRRAINITSELFQMHQFHGHLNQIHGDNYLCTPLELYNDIKAKGYDWSVLLDTRGYWLFDNDNPEHKPYLSTRDLLDMRMGTYTPYWMDADKKVSEKWLNAKSK